MDKKKVPYLCGGTFFILILQALKKNRRIRINDLDGKKAKEDAINEVSCLKGLMKTFYDFNENYSGSTFSKHKNQFKLCETNSTEWLQLESQSLIDNFDEKVRSNYPLALAAMNTFVEDFIDEGELGKKLIRALLEVIHLDDTILPNAEFFCLYDGSTQTKAQLEKIDKIDIQPFLLGIWHYIITNRVKNTDGAKTVASWLKHDAPQAPYKYVGTMGERYALNVDIKMLGAVETTPDTMRLVVNRDGMCPDISNPGSVLILDTIAESVLEGSDLETVQVGEARYKISNTQLAERLERGRRFVEKHYSDVIPSFSSDEESHISDYLDNAKKKHSKVRIILDKDIERPFYEYYVESDLQWKQRATKKQKDSKEEALIEKPKLRNLIADYSNCIILCGTGGQGKSMMLTHFFLSSIEDYKNSHVIPVFVSLKNFKTQIPDIMEYAFGVFTKLGGRLNSDQFKQMFKNGQGALFLDGIDEIPHELVNDFERKIEDLVDEYGDSLFVMTSRPFGPYNTLYSFNRFSVLYLSPLSMPQALELIGNLKGSNVDEELKSKFLRDLKNRLFTEKKDFAENPLLLTIMFMTYGQFGEVPSQMHKFYHEAYLTLAYRHDSMKGGYRRLLKTGLTTDRFKDYFSEFCARTFLTDQYELTEEQCSLIFKDLNYRKKDNCNALASDFMYDAVTNLCLMIYEGSDYYFVHRSFQEYFCALFYSQFKEKKLYNIGMAFERKHNKSSGDKAFEMLYEMIPEKINEFIIVPYIDSLIDPDEDDSTAFEAFLINVYESYGFDVGNDGPEYMGGNIPSKHYLYEFIVNEFGLTEYEWNQNAEPITNIHEDFLCERYFEINKNYQSATEDDDWVTIEKRDIPYDYESVYGAPEEVGRIYEIDFQKLFAPQNREKYKGLIWEIMDDSFCLKKEFNKVKALRKELASRASTSSEDLFDLD